MVGVLQTIVFVRRGHNLGTQTGSHCLTARSAEVWSGWRSFALLSRERAMASDIGDDTITAIYHLGEGWMAWSCTGTRLVQG